MFGVSRNFGSYKYLLTLFPAVGIFFATIEVILYPNMYSHNSAYIFYSTDRPFGLQKETITKLLALYAGVYASTISILAVQFIYRYWAIFHTTKLIYFKGFKFFIWVFYAVYFGIQYGFGLYYFERIDAYTRRYLEEDMMNKYGVDFFEIAGQAQVAYDENGSPRWWNIYCTINVSVIVFFQYSVITYCTARMYIEMESKLQLLSESLRTLHRQFFKTLVLQIATPTITLFIPISLIIYLPLFDMEIDLPTGILLCGFTVYPAMDAIIVMYIVKDYRIAIQSSNYMFLGKKFQEKVSDSFRKWLDKIYQLLRPADSFNAADPTTTEQPLSVLRVPNL
ncbi:hypothetical protein L5515_006520 [Caenorhabditis briggsae]|uniref:Seven TM Receptor n=1 Tax=Caenorhabditis briggsae TaxID=6238 RepID=A0AAE9A023_CAEBR|nr:hypothetical protein L3Y34_006697 [Caenorhabditis briggsae]UMM32856.1 hypothetical protein L5515_006520 [Caenorhabditis briggsae]